MRIQMHSLGTRGDLEILISLGAALTTRGHQVIVAAAPFFAPRIEQAGLAFKHLGHSNKDALDRVMTKLGRLPAGTGRTQKFYLQWVKPEMERVSERLLQWVTNADYFVNNLKMVVRRGEEIIPTASVTCEIPRRLSDLERCLIEDRNVLDLVAFSRPFVDPLGSWNDRFRFTGFWHPHHGDQTISNRLGEFVSQRPSIVVTMGSVTALSGSQFPARLTNVAARMGCSVVFLGGMCLPAALPDNAIQIDEAPYGPLFRLVRCAVHHASYGATVSSLRAGIASVVSPQLACQREMANTLTGHGLIQGIVDEQTTESKLAEYVERALEQPVSAQPDVQNDGAVVAAKLMEEHHATLA